MSWSKRVGARDWMAPPQTPQEVAVQEQTVDRYTLQRAKELLCELWKQGRVTAEVRFAAENALSAALEAVENPVLRKVSLGEGAEASCRQWLREQERKNDPF